MREKEEQRYGRNKETQVDKKYLESGEFRKKFDGISDSENLNRLLYQLAKKMLFHRAGTKFEDMYWISPNNYQVLAQETETDIEKKVLYSSKTKQIIKDNPNLITIHSHPDSFPPSIEDFNSNYENKYGLGIVVTHSGIVYMYSSQEHIEPVYYKLKVDEYYLEGYNESESQIKALEYCMSHFDIYFKEVTCDARRGNGYVLRR